MTVTSGAGDSLRLPLAAGACGRLRVTGTITAHLRPPAAPSRRHWQPNRDPRPLELALALALGVVCR